MTELLDLARTVAGWAGAGEEVEVFASRERTTEVRAYHGDVESISSAEPAGVGIRVVVAGRQGFASAGTLDETVLKETLEDARDNAAFAAPDDWVGVALPDDVQAPDIELWRESLASMATAAKVEMAIDLERRVLGADPRITGVRSAMYGDAMAESAVVTTSGIASAWRLSLCYVVVDALAEAGGDTQTSHGLSVARVPGDLDLEAAASDAIIRTTRLLGATKPDSRRVTVVLDPEVTSSFLSVLGSTLSGEAVLKGRSLFANRIGEEVAASGVTLIDDPSDPSAFGAEPYDGEGLARRRTVLVEQGLLRRFLYNTYAARRAGATSTASASRDYRSAPAVAPGALALDGGAGTQAELIAGIDEGVYVQSVSGLHSGVNPVSGDFSVGATGLRIRNGSLAEPFREATIASTLQRMLKDVAAIGADRRWMPGNAAGATLVVNDVSLGGT